MESYVIPPSLPIPFNSLSSDAAVPPVRSAGVIRVQPGSASVVKEVSDGGPAAQPKAKEAAKKGGSRNEPKQVR